VENIFNTLLERTGCFRGTTSTLALANEEGTSVFGRSDDAIASQSRFFSSDGTEEADALAIRAILARNFQISFLMK